MEVPSEISFDFCCFTPFSVSHVHFFLANTDRSGGTLLIIRTLKNLLLFYILSLSLVFVFLKPPAGHKRKLNMYSGLVALSLLYGRFSNMVTAGHVFVPGSSCEIFYNAFYVGSQ